MRELAVAERRQEILERLSSAGRVSVGDLSQEFGVSEVTIRADLQALAESNRLLRTHGGAIPIASGLQYLPLNLRRQQQIQEKAHIGSAAADLIADGDAVFLDSSSTALSIAQNLKTRRYLTVVTNGLAIAQELIDAPDVTVVVMGGVLRRDTASLVGQDGIAALQRFHIEKGFFGAHGITLAEGLTDVSAQESEVKRPLINMCRTVVAVVDATKWGRVGLSSFAHISQVNTVITDAHAPAELISQVRAAGVGVLLV